MSQPFSVCISVYQKDNPEYFLIALNSIINQTVQPKEIILVVDGPVSEHIENIICNFKQNYSIIKDIRLPHNRGLGNALNIAVKRATCSLIARMDSDDISMPDRFEKQLLCFEKDPELSVVGGSIKEFVGHESNIIGHRTCPLTDSINKRYMKYRCGFNHMTVMMRKSDVIKAGNYQDWFWNEDYYLWIRMMETGCKFQNLADNLVNVRVGADMYSRRGGIKYFKSEAALQWYMLQHNIIDIHHYIFNILLRFFVQVMLPNKLRALIFQNLFRKRLYKNNI